MNKQVQSMIERFNMQRHHEGGWYAPSWRSGLTVAQNALPEPFKGDRDLASVIYYLLPREEESCWHAVCGDEIWFWQCGGTLELRQSAEGGNTVSQRRLLGDLLRQPAACPHVLVPGGVWQTAKVTEGDFVLVSCLVSPGYEDADFSLPDNL